GPRRLDRRPPRPGKRARAVSGRGLAAGALQHAVHVAAEAPAFAGRFRPLRRPLGLELPREGPADGTALENAGAHPAVHEALRVDGPDLLRGIEGSGVALLASLAALAVAGRMVGADSQRSVDRSARYDASALQQIELAAKRAFLQQRGVLAQGDVDHRPQVAVELLGLVAGRTGGLDGAGERYAVARQRRALDVLRTGTLEREPVAAGERSAAQVLAHPHDAHPLGLRLPRREAERQHAGQREHRRSSHESLLSGEARDGSARKKGSQTRRFVTALASELRAGSFRSSSDPPAAIRRRGGGGPGAPSGPRGRRRP